MDNKTIARLRSQLTAISTICVALLRGHPEKQKLLASIDSVAEETLSMLLDSKTSDEEIELTKQLINTFRAQVDQFAKPL